MNDESSHLSNEFEELLALFIDDNLNAEQSQRLAGIIETDSAARKIYLDHCRIHAGLAWEHGVLGGISFPEDSADSEPEKQKSTMAFFRRPWIRPLAIAAGLALLAGVFWTSVLPAWDKHQWQSGVVLGKVTRNSGGILKVADLDIVLNQEDVLRSGQYELLDGLAQLVLENDVEILIEAPARFQLTSTNMIKLTDGRLSAYVPLGKAGFVVETPNAEIVDFGTEFGVEVDTDYHSEVHVFEGVVEVKALNTADEPVRLVSEQATRVNGRSGEPQGIVIAPERFIRTFEEPIRPYSAEILLLNPVAYYRMKICDDGLTLEDKSVNNHHGVIDRGTQTRCIFATGRIGSAFRLTGANGGVYAVVPDYPKTQNNQLSVVAWVKAESRPRWATIAKNLYKSQIGQFGFGLFHDQGGLEAEIHQTNGEIVRVKDTEALPLQKWHHVAFVADGQFLRLYLNGSEIDKQPYDTIATPTYPELTIGAKFYTKQGASEKSTGGVWDGRLDELAIFNHGLTAENIQRLYAAAGPSETYAVR